MVVLLPKDAKINGLKSEIDDAKAAAELKASDQRQTAEKAISELHETEKLKARELQEARAAEARVSEELQTQHLFSRKPSLRATNWRKD